MDSVFHRAQQITSAMEQLTADLGFEEEGFEMSQHNDQKWEKATKMAIELAKHCAQNIENPGLTTYALSPGVENDGIDIAQSSGFGFDFNHWPIVIRVHESISKKQLRQMLMAFIRSLGTPNQYQKHDHSQLPF